MAPLICYASRIGTRRNLVTIRRLGWRLLVSRGGNWRHEGLPYAIDNGAWSDFRAARGFDGDAFETLVERMGAGADWIVLPDIVAGGLASLALSIRWLNRCLSVCPLVLIAVQDGMTEADLAPLVGPGVGIFLGGSTGWKLATMGNCGAFCTARGLHYHVARVNTERRFRMAHAANATSIDGSSLTRFAVTAPLLHNAACQPDLMAGWAP